MAIKKKEKSKDKPVNKTPELSKAKNELDSYLKENKLDPTKDWTKDKKHGKKITELVNKLNKERDKVAAQYPEKDLDNEKKLVKMKKAADDEKEAKKKEKKDKAESSSKAGRVTQKYDYPLVDGKEMTSDQKKKYRMEQRKLSAGKATKEKGDTKVGDTKKEKVLVKTEEVSAKKDKKAKDKKKKKKAVKEED